MNEEFDNTYNTPNREYYDNINAYNQIFVDTVRKSGGKNNVRYLLIPGWNTDINYFYGVVAVAVNVDYSVKSVINAHIDYFLHSVEPL